MSVPDIVIDPALLALQPPHFNAAGISQVTGSISSLNASDASSGAQNGPPTPPPTNATGVPGHSHAPADEHTPADAPPGTSTPFSISPPAVTGASPLEGQAHHHSSNASASTDFSPPAPAPSAPAPSAPAPSANAPSADHASGASSKTKAKKGPGRQSWVQGEKLIFLESLKENYLTAKTDSALSDFLDYLQSLWLYKYGYDLPLDAQLDGPVPDVSNVQISAVPGLQDVTPEVAKQRAAYIKTLRRKLYSWYYNKYNTLRRRDQADEVNALIRHMAEPKRQRKLSVLNAYNKLFWECRIKQVVEERWEPMEAEWALKKARGEADDKQKNAAHFKLQNEVAKELYDAEDEETKAAVMELVKKDGEEKAAAASQPKVLPVPETPEEYDHAMKHLPPYLQNIADSLMRRTGMICSIMLCGPIPDKGGKLAVRSLHCGTIPGTVPGKTWPDVDPAGYGIAETSMTRFAARIFTKDDMDARALPGTIQLEKNDDPAALPAFDDGLVSLKQPLPSSHQSATQPLSSELPRPRQQSTPSLPLRQTSSNQEAPPPKPSPPSQPGLGGPTVHPSQAALQSQSQPMPLSSASMPPPPQPQSSSWSQSPPPFDPPLTPQFPLPSPAATSMPSSYPPLPPQPYPPPSPASSTPPAPMISVVWPSYPPAEFGVEYAGMQHQELQLQTQQAAAKDAPDIADFPAHCREAFKIVVDKYAWSSMYKRWAVCIEGMLRLEIDSKFTGKDVRLPARTQTNRPVAFKRWFQEGRPSKAPDGIEVDAFSKASWAWWLDMQPAARGSSKRGRDVAVSLEDWNNTVRKPTLSGFYLIMVALVWWGIHVFEHGEGTHTLGDWQRMVDDVAWAVESWTRAKEELDQAGSSDDCDDRGSDGSGNEGPVGSQGRGKQAAATNRKRKAAAPRTTRKRRR
ncbi:hypothetical protein EIP86_007351 [Pleurotus ostreatoroseus]|nr:hypothetical protein EIP86_007351 [Pleurotus ostreatoroseus]